MSNNRPAPKSDEKTPPAQSKPQSTLSINTDDSSSISNSRLLAREAGRVVVIGSGVAAGLYPLDLVMQYLHTTTKGPASPRSPISGIPLGAARALLKGYANSASNSMIKNAALQQRGRLLNSEKTVGEEKPDMRAEDFEEGNTASNLSLTRLATVSGVIGLADTTLTQYFANQRTWNIHQFYLKQEQIHYTIPKPRSPSDYFKTYSAGYSLRLSRNVLLVGGLLTSSIFEERLKYFNSLSPGERTLAAAMLAGSTAGFGSNVLDIVYKNQIININKKDFQTPSALSTAKKLIADNGVKALTRGYGTSIIYTVAAYNIVPYMEDVAQAAIPKVEQALSKVSGFILGFFNPRKQTSASKSRPAIEAPTSSTVRQAEVKSAPMETTPASSTVRQPDAKTSSAEETCTKSRARRPGQG